jgi:hypothetical protein
MAIVCRRRSTPHPLAGRSAAEDGGGATFLPREEWAKPRGRKSRRRRCGSGDRGAAVLRLDQAMERPWVARRTASSGEVVANLRGPAKGLGLPGEETAAMGQKKEASSPRPIGADRHLPHGVRRLHQEETVEALQRGSHASRSGTRSSPRSVANPVIRTERSSALLAVRPPLDRRVSRVSRGDLPVRRRGGQRQASSKSCACPMCRGHRRSRRPGDRGFAK